MPITITVKHKEVTRKLQRLQKRMNDLTPVMRVIGETARSSILENFRAGGRPKRWKESRRVTNEGGETLRLTGRLANSITSSASRTKAVIGTNVKYAAIHNFGGSNNVTVRSHTRKRGKINYRVRSFRRTQKMPKREFMLLQKEDYGEIVKVIQKYYVKSFR